MIRNLLFLFSVFTISSTWATDGIILLEDQSPVSTRINHVKLVSRENDNSRFQLTLDRIKPFPHDHGKLGLLIGGKTIRFSSGGYHSPTNHTVGAAIYGEELADAVARHFNIKAVKRTHPGHRLVVRFKAAKETFTTSETVTAELRIKNVGGNDFVFMQGGRQRGYRDNQFAFSCQHDQKMLPDVGNPMNFGGLGGFKAIAPGRTHIIRVDLRKWFKFSTPGTYALRGSYYLEIMDSVAGGTVWEDIVADEFSVRIK